MVCLDLFNMTKIRKNSKAGYDVHQPKN